MALIRWEPGNRPKRQDTIQTGPEAAVAPDANSREPAMASP